MGWFALGALGCAVGVMAGAFGAHGLAARLDERGLALWETAVRYWMYGSFGLLAPKPASVAGWCLVAGALVFSGTVGALALGAPRFLGAITPLGGLALIAGFFLLGWAALHG